MYVCMYVCVCVCVKLTKNIGKQYMHLLPTWQKQQRVCSFSIFVRYNHLSSLQTLTSIKSTRRQFFHRNATCPQTILHTRPIFSTRTFSSIVARHFSGVFNRPIYSGNTSFSFLTSNQDLSLLSSRLIEESRVRINNVVRQQVDNSTVLVSNY